MISFPPFFFFTFNLAVHTTALFFYFKKLNKIFVIFFFFRGVGYYFGWERITKYGQLDRCVFIFNPLFYYFFEECIYYFYLYCYSHCRPYTYMFRYALLNDKWPRIYVWQFENIVYKYKMGRTIYIYDLVNLLNSFPILFYIFFFCYN